MVNEVDYQILRNIGLTNSEIKVYVALLKIGISSKGSILKESKTAPSKLYYVIDKLIEKGLVSIITKNNVKHFSPAPPLRIKDYLDKKKEEIMKNQELLDNLLPKLNTIKNKKVKETKVGVFIGWKGMETVYLDLVSNCHKNDKAYILGAGASSNEERLERFFLRYSKLALKKGVKTKIIFDESSKAYVERIEKKLGKKYDRKFLYEATPSEILIHKEKVVILIRKEEPIVIVIEDLETSRSFLSYFNILWDIAKS
ncbi:MAG: helix-turn-helix domain-containing protein [Nanoarchaeota archaeon]